MDLLTPFAPSYFCFVTYNPLFKISRVHHCHLNQSRFTRTAMVFLQRLKLIDLFTN